MIVFCRLVVVAMLAGFLGACASHAPVEASASKLAAIKTIAVLSPPEPETYRVENLSHPGIVFGLVGGLVAAADQSAKQDKLSSALKSQGAAIVSGMAKQLVSHLSRSGYKARVENAPWEKKGSDFVLAYDKIQSDADAVLIMEPTQMGFLATGPVSDYVPTIKLEATLLGKDRKEPMYRGFYIHSGQYRDDKWKTITPKTTFPNFEAMISNTKAVADALNEAGAALAQSVGADLRR